MKKASIIISLLSFTIAGYSQDTILNVHIERENGSCVNGLVAKMSAWGIGGHPPYSYSWDNNESPNTILNIEAGYHSVVVTDAYGNTASAGSDVRVSASLCSNAAGVEFPQFPDLTNVHPSTAYDVNFLPSQGVGFYEERMTLSNNSLFIMEGVPFIVHAGASLTLDNCDLRAWAGMWKGIIVESGATLTLNNTSIQGAEYGIYAMNGSRIYINNCHFTNNVVGIETAKNDPDAINSIDFAIAGTTFEFTGSFHDAYPGQAAFGTKPKAGIIFNNMLGTIGDYSYTQNVFKNLNCGIISDNSTLTIDNCSFYSISKDPFYQLPYSGSAVACIGGAGASSVTLNPVINQAPGNPTFANCDYGVYADNLSLSVINCTMEVMGTGILVTRCGNNSYVILKSNNISASLAGIQFNNNTGAGQLYAGYNNIQTTAINGVCIGAYESGDGFNNLTVEANNLLCIRSLIGIDVSGCSGTAILHNVISEVSPGAIGFKGINLRGCSAPEISCNVITGRTAAPDHDSYGIRIDLTELAVIQCNMVARTTWGMGFFGLCPSTDNIKDNEMREHFEGLYVNSSGITGTQLHGGNRWLGPFSNRFGANNLNSSIPGLQASRFTVHTTPRTIYYPEIPTYDLTWFATDERGIPYSCLGHKVCQPGGNLRISMAGSSDPLDGYIAEGQSLSVDFEAETKSMASQYLFDKLNSLPDLINANSAFRNFYHSYSASSAGALQRVKNNILRLDDDTPLVNDIHAIDLKLKILFDNVSRYDKLMYGDFLNVQQYTTQKQNLKLQANSLQSSLAELKKQLYALKAVRIAAVRTDNQSISLNQIPENNEQLINQVYLETVASGKYDLSESQAAIVLNIAQQCPYSGGKAVYRARTLYQLIDPAAQYDDNKSCFLKAKNHMERESSEANSILLLPNPADENVTVIFATSEEGTCNLHLTDLAGKIIKSVDLPCEIQQYEFSVSDLTAGLYLVDIISNGSSIGKAKLVIMK